MVLAACTPRSDPAPGQPACTPVSVATFNVHMLFDTRCDSGQCGPGDFERVPSETAFAAQTARLAEAIGELDADVLLLQEIETQAALDGLLEALGERYGFAWLGETGRPGSIDVAVVSSLAPVRIQTHRDRPLPLPGGGTTTFAREFPEVHLEVEGKRVVVFSAHFKSKAAPDDPDRRLAEARAAADIVRQAAAAWPEALVVLGGDLNDVPGSPPLQALEDDGGLHRVARDLGEAAGTYRYDGTWQAIDHLLRAPEAAGVYLPHTAWVHRDPGTRGLGGSDHAALRADFCVP